MGIAFAKPRQWSGLIIASFVASVGSSVGSGAETVPDFTLVDVNATSSTHNHLVSPRDYQGKVSGWYFGHAT